MYGTLGLKVEIHHPVTFHGEDSAQAWLAGSAGFTGPRVEA